jgi:hypothetical protein
MDAAHAGGDAGSRRMMEMISSRASMSHFR